MTAIKKETLKKLRAHKRELQDSFPMETLGGGGSVSRGEEREDSAIDILVRYNKTPGLFSFLDLNDYLEEIVGRPVDLGTEGALKKQLRKTILEDLPSLKGQMHTLLS